ncbi:MAG: 16S rRNA processing protein RimM [Clostridia bacterium]|nr:16S rRNA processing protein RimM [Clostridia bacterium]MBQ5764619.1 16S rRNA processing protein RimM [Clostridia bacterium]
MKKDFIESGKIVGTHGVRGGLRVQPWCDTPEFLCGFKKLFLKQAEAFNPVKVKSAKPHGNIVIMELDLVDTMEKAEALRNKVLFVERSAFKLEKDQYLICDLIGCDVFDADTNKLLGAVSDVSKTGANDVWHIKNGDNEYLIPVIDDVVIDVNVDENKVVIRPLKGIFEE